MLSRARTNNWHTGHAIARTMRVGWVVTCASFLGASGQLAAAPVADELERPAIAVARPDRGVLLDIATAGKRLVSVGEHGLVIVSDDLGFTWRQVASPVSVSLTAVTFVNAQSGWAVGHRGVILHTADGGEHWELQLDGERAARLALEAAQAQGTGINNIDPLEVKRQLADAERLVADGADKPFFDTYFANDQVGWAVGAFGLCFRTTDGGDTWLPWMQHLANPDGLHLYVMTGLDQTFFVAGERGLLLRSIDGGVSFDAIDTPGRGSFFTLTSAPPSQLVVAGMGGHAYRSVDSGKSWHTLEGSGGVTWMASTALSENRILLADQFGKLIVTRSQSNKLVGLNLAPGGPLAGVLQTVDGSLVAAGLRGISRIALPSVSEATQ